MKMVFQFFHLYLAMKYKLNFRLTASLISSTVKLECKHRDAIDSTTPDSNFPLARQTSFPFLAAFKQHNSLRGQRLNPDRYASTQILWLSVSAILFAALWAVYARDEGSCLYPIWRREHSSSQRLQYLNEPLHLLISWGYKAGVAFLDGKVTLIEV